jgi:glycosyltransferase involved in cell wall biosynthesis
MADAIDFLLSHDLQRLRLGKNAAGDARQRFDLEQQSSVYLKWYEEILDRSNHAASDSK